MKSRVRFISKEKIFSDYLNLTNMAVVIDKNIITLYPYLKSKFKNCPIYIFDANEENKSFSELEKVIDYFLSKGVNRQTHLVAIGGGVTSDFAGVVASLLNRGISWSIIPTTLLSMVDAAHGGKCAINSKYGKNLIGAFHLPLNVFIDQSFLHTLALSEFLSGLGEIYKYAFLSKKIFKAIKAKKDVNYLIELSVEHKEKVVKKDFFEKGLRKSLNWGHTIGHAIELKYKVPHGIAIYYGIELKRKIFDLNLPDVDLSYLGGFFPEIKFEKSDISDLLEYITHDKKNTLLDFINFVEIYRVGKFKMKSVSINDVEKKLGMIVE